MGQKIFDLVMYGIITAAMVFGGWGFLIALSRIFEILGI